MKKILTIDFDIIMNPSIEVFNDYEGTATEYTTRFDFLGLMPADLELYQQLTEFLLTQQNKKIYFMEDHHEIVKLTKGDGPFELVNIDHHHDLGYGDNIRWNAPVREIETGNWVHKLWELNRVTKYIWLKDQTSIDPPARANKFITEKHYVYTYDLTQLSDVVAIYISHSPEWIPAYYEPLYEIWTKLFKNASEEKETFITLEEQNEAEQLSFI